MGLGLNTYGAELPQAYEANWKGGGVQLLVMFCKKKGGGGALLFLCLWLIHSSAWGLRFPKVRYTVKNAFSTTRIFYVSFSCEYIFLMYM